MALFLGGGVASLISAPSWTKVRRAIAARFPTVSSVSTKELAAWLTDPRRAQPLLLDVRAREEYEISHLPGAVWAATTEQQKAVLLRAAPDQPIVVYCSVGWRSAQAAAELGKPSGRVLLNLDGSIFEWANESRPLVDTHGAPVRVVHPFDRTWGALLDRNRWSHDPSP